jgi:hypothetical protein
MEVRGAVTARRSKQHVAEAPARGAASGQRIWIARRTCLLGRNVALLGAAAIMCFSGVEDDGPVSITILVALCFVAAAASNSLRVLRDVGHLPIPRARLAPWVLLPPLGALLAGFAGIALRQHLDPGVDRAEEVDLRSRGEHSERVSVPGALLVPVLGREPLVVTAPWGESAALRPEPLVPGSPLAFANPYDIAPDSSLDFVAWQLSRAVRAAHGVEVAPEELRERYLSMLDGRVIGPFFGQRLRRDHPELERVARPGRVGWMAVTVVLGWLLACAFATRGNVPPPDRTAWRRARRRVYACSVAAGVLLVLLLVLPFAQVGRLDGVQDALAGALVRAVGGNEWIVPAAAVALAIAGYRWLARRFARLEVPPPLKRTWYEGSG